MSAPSPSAWTPWRASARFAERLAERHARTTSHTPPVGRATLRGARAMQVSGRGRLDVRVSVRMPIATITSPGRERLESGGAPPPGTYAHSTRSPASKFAESAQANAERIVARGATLSLVPLARHSSSPIDARRDAAPIPRVVRRGAPADAAQAARDPDPARLEARREQRTTRSIGSAHVEAAAPLSRPELDRITSHVVETIDRRIAAARERHGRI